MKRDKQGRAPRPGLQRKVLGLPWNSLLRWDHVAQEVNNTRSAPPLNLGSRLAEAGDVGGNGRGCTGEEAKTTPIVLRERGNGTDKGRRRPRSGSDSVERGEQRTNIVCALGPSSNTTAVLGEMIDGGMRVARINLSHGTLESHVAALESLHEALRKRGRRARVAVLLDTRGPEIRTGRLDPERCGGKVEGEGGGEGESESEGEGACGAEEEKIVGLCLSDGDVVEILGVESHEGEGAFLGGFYTDAELGRGEEEAASVARLSCNLGAAIVSAMSPGARVLLADGTIVLEVLSCHGGGAEGGDGGAGALPYIRCRK